ncbi:uncharacterized protein LOC119628672 isoform X1 [Bombyx mori]|uniref:Uncharacterized protein n=1 Tax=Bombyx mori TaxID=7091 RepID=A0A8R2LWH4_BOMMO|nr:uncharacterized protein LOC119628672 isoform X2 [Bombyx mori]
MTDSGLAGSAHSNSLCYLANIYAASKVFGDTKRKITYIVLSLSLRAEDSKDRKEKLFGCNLSEALKILRCCYFWIESSGTDSLHNLQ